MNVTLSEAVEIQVKTGSRKPVGMMMMMMMMWKLLMHTFKLVNYR